MKEKKTVGVFCRRNNVDVCYGGPYEPDEAQKRIEELKSNYKIEPRSENPDFIAKPLSGSEGELWWDGRFRHLTPDGKIEFTPGSVPSKK